MAEKRYSKVNTASDFVIITPSDTIDIPKNARALRFGTTGTVALVRYDDSVVNLPEVVVGEVFPGQVKRVNATGTTATSILAFFD